MDQPAAQIIASEQIEKERHTESSWNTNDQGIARTNLSGKVDLSTWVSLGELNAWDRISDLDHICDRRCV